MRALRILIADDHAAVRKGIRSFLESRTVWKICGEARDGAEAVEMARRFAPDVVLLDATMPRLSGLEAARELRRHLPAAQVLVLTTHTLDVVEEEFRRAGAHAILSKTEIDRSLIAAIEAVRPRRGPIHLAGSVVDRHRHIAALFHSNEERDRVLGPFIAEGLQRDEKALHLIDRRERRSHLARLLERGIEADRAEARGQLEVVPWEEGYLRDGRFDADAMLDRLRELIDGGTRQGYPLTRVIGHMEWALEERPGVAELVRYETSVSHVLDDYDDVVVCAYDVTKFPDAILSGVTNAHTAVVIDGSLQTVVAADRRSSA
jgi:DNA-binding NarL/FixJ family response regulator